MGCDQDGLSVLEVFCLLEAWAQGLEVDRTGESLSVSGPLGFKWRQAGQNSSENKAILFWEISHGVGWGSAPRTPIQT